MKRAEQIKITASVAYEADVLAKARDYAAEQKISFSKLCNTALAEFIAKSANEKSKIINADASAFAEKKNYGNSKIALPTSTKNHLPSSMRSKKKSKNVIRIYDRFSVCDWFQLEKSLPRV